MDTDIAIIGMSCRFPEANNVEEFWENLISGRDSVRSLPTERKYMAGSVDLKAGYLKCPLDEFDLNFFNISPKEGPYIDPQQRLFLEVSWESLEDAGIPPTSLSGTQTGVFLGIGSDDYWRNYLNTTVADEKMYKILGNVASAAPGRLSYFLNLRGPSIPLEVTCASSALALHTAVVSLQNTECSLAIAGGVNLILQTDTIFPNNIISSNSRSFSSQAAGFAPAEGCGVVVLRPLSIAIAAGNRIHGIIRGTGTNHTGRSTSFGTPQITAEEMVIRDTLGRAGVEPSQISFVEAHAGGTYLGDPIEFKSIAAVFGAGPSRDLPLILTCCKPNVGHPMAAAGIAGLIKTLLCLKYRIIPPQLHLSEIHPEINLSSIPAILPTSQTFLPPNSGTPLLSTVNCFGITGTNVCLVVQEPPQQTRKCPTSTSKHHLLTISAKDEMALDSLCLKYAVALETAAAQDIPVADWVFSANAGRAQMEHRVALVGSSHVDLSFKLRNKQWCRDVVNSGAEKTGIVFMFTGHGCQYVGMGKELYEGSPVFRAAIDSCDAIYREELGLSLKEFIWTPGHDLASTKYSQPAIFAVEYALFQFWSSLGLLPDLVVGHSIGEFAATVAAGVLSMEEALKLLCFRSKAIEELPQGRMIAVPADSSRIKSMIAEFMKAENDSSCWVDLACENSSEQSVVSMAVETEPKFKSFLAKQVPSIKATRIQSQHSFHSRAMDQILDAYEKFANEVIRVREPTTRIISGLLAREIGSTDISALYWRNHCRQPVRFSDAIDWILNFENVSVFLEVSPQPTLTNFFLSNLSIREVSPLVSSSLRRGHDPWLSIMSTLAKLYVKSTSTWKFESLLTGSLVDIPKYSFTRKQCWAPRREKSKFVLNIGENCHSLLGTCLSVPDDIRYLGYLSSSNPAYLKDHLVFDHVIVPGACFVEMCLTIAAVELEQKVVVLEGFEISSALVLSKDEEARRVQTVSSDISGKSVTLSIFSDTPGKKTILHARGKLILGTQDLILISDSVDMEELKVNHAHELTSETFYNELASIGLGMGPEFRSVLSLHYNADKSQVLTSFRSETQRGSDTVCHPIILDAMIQSICGFKLLSANDGSSSFGLPVGFDRFVMNSGWVTDSTELLYFHYVEDQQAGKIYNSSGKTLGIMQGFKVLRSTQAGFLKSIGTCQLNLPQFMSKSLSKLNLKPTPELLFNSSDSRRPTWLIFGSREDALQGHITTKLGNLGRTVVGIEVGRHFTRANGVFKVNPTRLEDFTDLISVFQHSGPVEGVLYMWGLTACQERLTEVEEFAHVQEKLTSGLFHLFQTQANTNWTSKIVLITMDSREKNPAQGALWGLHETYIAEHPEFESLAIDLDGENESIRSAAQVMGLLFQKTEERGIYFQGNEALGFRLGNLDSTLPLTQIELPNASKFKLADIRSLKFVPDAENQDEPGIEIGVRAVGLNFRDFLLSHSLLETTHPDSVGLEFSGIVTSGGSNSNSQFKVGDRVVGVTTSGGIRSHIVVSNPRRLFKIPDDISFAAAATIPVAYITTYMSLVRIGKVKPNERVLIHTASGGVGIAGIHLARFLGAHVFVTAGTKKKREYLRDCLGLFHVYNSRTQAYQEEILRDTNGAGVDVILNTLTGGGFKEASLDCLALSGRFVELSKLNIWNTQEVAALRPDVVYTIYDAFSLMVDENPELLLDYADLAELIGDRKLCSLPTKIYPLSQLASAIKSFQTHEHIGKIVVEIPERVEQLSRVTLFNAQSTYVVIGGLGRTGFEVAKYIYEQGGNVAILGRSETSKEQDQALTHFQDRMTYIKCDIRNYESVKTIFKKFHPPLRGIFHCAVTYANGLIAKQSLAEFSKSFQAKVYGTWNLHELTKSIPLDYFVTFSSITSVFGARGLGNYTAANRYLDSFSRYRANLLGLPSTNVNWGVWAEVGEAVGYNVGMFQAFHGFSTVAGLEALDRALRLGLNDIVIADFDKRALEKYPKVGPYLCQLTTSSNGSRNYQGNGNKGTISEGNEQGTEANIFKLHAAALAASPRDRFEKMQDFLEAALKQHMGNYDGEVLERTKPFALMGMDSLIGMELRITVNELLGVKLEPNAIQEFDSIYNLARYLTNHLNSREQETDGDGTELEENNNNTNTPGGNNLTVHSKILSEGKSKLRTSKLKATKRWPFFKKRDIV